MCEYKGYKIYEVYKDAVISIKTGIKKSAFEECWPNLDRDNNK